MIEHCISAYNLYIKDEIYKIYITDCLRILIGGETPIPRYVDLIQQSQEGEKETETAEQIKARLCARLDALGGEANGDAVRNDD